MKNSETKKFETKVDLHNRNDMRAIKVTYSNGDTISTSMAKSLTDDEMLNYFSIGKWFNLGSVGDNMQQVTNRQILR